MFGNPPSCRQNLLLFIQPRWQPRTYFFNHCVVLFLMNLHLQSKPNTQLINSCLHFDTFLSYDWPFPRVYFAKNVAYFPFNSIIFPFNSWLSFQRLCRLLWGFLACGFFRGRERAVVWNAKQQWEWFAVGAISRRCCHIQHRLSTEDRLCSEQESSSVKAACCSPITLSLQLTPVIMRSYADKMANVLRL